ncbi:hypothetical protein SKUL_17 [Pseudomonas phage Skulduggery]|uniref:Uncharacterized protein n=1 Tax=Pseudomonas phage Skulduggery TaxID=2006671 RepID=A0A1Y0SZL2_9CAUD|nr:virion structural protein [Pseudomonas phage Skulduggery]ARV77116.1 hypothetical protein SKUL_17 [Pseudomonas phage Skulduggery]
MADLYDFMRYIRPQAKSVLEPMAYEHLREAAIEFCRRLRCWRHVAEIYVREGETPVIPVPEGANLFELESLFIDTHQLKAATFQELDHRRQDGQAYQFALGMDNVLTINPHQAGNLRITMYLEPSQDCEELPDFMFNDHGRKLAAGALMRLLTMPDQAYTDMQRAQMFGGEFAAYLDHLSTKQKQGKQRARLRSRPNNF